MICKIFCLYESQSPITHMSGTMGNEAIIMREANYSGDGVSYIPVLSGNALRHKMIREFGAQYLIDSLELKGKLNIDQLNFLLHGGTLMESSITDDMKNIAKMQRLFPLYKLLGGSLKNQIVPGFMIVTRGLLVCKENIETIKNLLPIDWKFPDIKLDSYESFVDFYQYTRGDAKKKLGEDQEDNRKKSNLMIYNGQTIMQGSMFCNQFILNQTNDLELGAFFLSIKLWQGAGGIIGGKSSIGHGRLQINLSNDNKFDIDKLIEQYESYVNENKIEQIEWLNENFK